MARPAAGPEEVAAAQALRHLCFVTARGLPARPGGLDRDAHDAACRHLVVEEGGALVATARLRSFADREAAGASYAASVHDLAALPAARGPFLEIGRVCARPGAGEAAALRALWAGVTRLVDAEGVGLLFGCASFGGADPGRHAAALALLAQGRLLDGPQAPRARRTVDLARLPAPGDRGAALAGLPPLLRTYLAMGARVGRFAVVDRALDTLHVLVTVAPDAVPPARARALRALAGERGR